jgi:zinc protease
MSNTLRTQLDNGLTVLIKEAHHAPVATLWLWYRVGSRNENVGTTGISHWVEHMLFKGSASFPKGEIDRRIAREGGVFNGLTWLDFTTYFETLPSDRIDLALQIEADRMCRSLFDPAEVEAEREVVISEREGHENSPGFQLAEEVQSLAFRAHPYGHEVIGWKSDLRTITRQQLWDHYRTYYQPASTIVAAAGDFDAQDMLANVARWFGDIPSGPDVPQVNVIEPEQRGQRRVTVHGEDETAYLSIAFRAPRATDADFFPFQTLDTILGGAKSMNLFGGEPPNRSSRLYKTLVDTGLASSVDTGLGATVDPFMFSVNATVMAGRELAEVEEAVVAEIARIRDQPVTQAELDTAIRQTQAQFAYSCESVTNLGFWLGFSEIVADLNWFDSYLERLQAVTADDVAGVAHTYLDDRRRVTGWYVPER